MTHIVSKRSSKLEAEKEAAYIRKHVRSGTKITIRKYSDRLWGVYME